MVYLYLLRGNKDTLYMQPAVDVATVCARVRVELALVGVSNVAVRTIRVSMG